MPLKLHTCLLWRLTCGSGTIRNFVFQKYNNYLPVVTRLVFLLEKETMIMKWNKITTRPENEKPLLLLVEVKDADTGTVSRHIVNGIFTDGTHSAADSRYIITNPFFYEMGELYFDFDNSSIIPAGFWVALTWTNPFVMTCIRDFLENERLVLPEEIEEKLDDEGNLDVNGFLVPLFDKIVGWVYEESLFTEN